MVVLRDEWNTYSWENVMLFRESSRADMLRCKLLAALYQLHQICLIPKAICSTITVPRCDEPWLSIHGFQKYTFEFTLCNTF